MDKEIYTKGEQDLAFTYSAKVSIKVIVQIMKIIDDARGIFSANEFSQVGKIYDNLESGVKTALKKAKQELKGGGSPPIKSDSPIKSKENGRVVQQVQQQVQQQVPMYYPQLQVPQYQPYIIQGGLQGGYQGYPQVPMIGQQQMMPQVQQQMMPQVQQQMMPQVQQMGQQQMMPQVPQQMMPQVQQMGQQQMMPQMTPREYPQVPPMDSQINVPLPPINESTEEEELEKMPEEVMLEPI